jgi:hypothetical protein
MAIPVSIVSTTQDLSDWIVVGAAVVQAVGSVAAIIAATLIARHDRIEGRRLGLQSRNSALAAVISRAEDTLRESYDQLVAENGHAYGQVFGQTYGKNVRTLEQCLKILRAVPAHELGDWELVSAVFDMEEALVSGHAALEKIRAENKAVLMYPDMGRVNATPLEDPVNLAAEAVARIHNSAHRLSKPKRANKYRITPRYVGARAAEKNSQTAPA